MKPSHHRLWRVLDSIDHVWQHRRLGGGAELLDIRTGRETASARLQQDPLHCWVFQGGGQRLYQSGPYNMAQGIHRRVKECDQAAAAAAGQSDGLAHGALSRWLLSAVLAYSAMTPNRHAISTGGRA